MNYPSTEDFVMAKLWSPSTDSSCHTEGVNKLCTIMQLSTAKLGKEYDDGKEKCQIRNTGGPVK